MTRWPRCFVLAAALVATLCGVLVSSTGRVRLDATPEKEDFQDRFLEDAAAIKSVDVFFATNRKREKMVKPGVYLGGQRGEPTFGTCEIEFKPIPMMGEIAQKVPFYVPTETSDLRIELEADPEVFWKRFTTASKATSSGDVVLFIHGYSYDFERSCGRAAEAQRVLQDQATVLMFTWPSDGDATAYMSDQTDLEWSVPFLQSILRELADRFGPEHLHILAHSMGSRGVVQALEGWKLDQEDVPLMGRLVLLAPDLDAQMFVERLPTLVPLAESITLYASGADTPLKISRQLNGSPRLGQAGELLTVAEGMETVDVTPAGRYQYLGHEYFYFHPQVGADLVELVTTGKRASERSGLRTRRQGKLVYWEVIPQEER